MYMQKFTNGIAKHVILRAIRPWSFLKCVNKYSVLKQTVLFAIAIYEQLFIFVCVEDIRRMKD